MVDIAMSILFFGVLLIAILFILGILLGLIKLDEPFSIGSRKKKVNNQDRKSNIIYQNHPIKIGLPTALLYRDVAGYLSPSEEFLGRADYFVAHLSLAVVRFTPNKLLLFKLPRGEFRGQWQFLGGYVDPRASHEYNNPKIKAEYSIRQHLGIDANFLEYSGRLTEGELYYYRYSNPANVMAHVYEYFITKKVLDSIEADYYLIDFAEVENVHLDEPIALYVFEILDRYYEEVVYSEAFENELELAVKIAREKLEP